MNDEALNVWKAYLALSSSDGVAWMKFASLGVVHDYKNEANRGPSAFGNDDLTPDLLDRIAANRSHYLAATAAMKERDGPRGQIIDFASAASRQRSLGSRASAGVADVQVKK